MIVMVRTGSVLKTTATPRGILDLEFAYDTVKTKAIIRAWSPAVNEGRDLVAAAGINTGYDFVFLFFYSGFLYLTCLGIADLAPRSRRVGRLLARGALIAGCLDVLENVGMLLALEGMHDNSIAIMTTCCAAVKWMLALLALGYLLIVGGIVLIYWIRARL